MIRHDSGPVSPVALASMTSLPLTRPATRATPLAVARLARWFYVGAAMAALITVFVGFAPSFYLRSPTKPGLSLRVASHGVLFSSWILLFLAQTGLVATRRVELHRRLGLVAAIVAATMVATGPLMALALARRGQPGRDPLGFMFVILVDLFFFAMFVGAGIYFRRRPEIHKHCMLLATISMLPPSISRWPIAVRYPVVIFAVILLFVGSAVAYDLWTRRRIHPVTLWGGLGLVASGPIRLAIAASATWHHIARWLIA